MHYIEWALQSWLKPGLASSNNLHLSPVALGRGCVAAVTITYWQNKIPWSEAQVGHIY